MQKNKSKHYLEYIFVALGYLVLTLIFTYPLVLHFATAISGWQPMTDGELFLWNFWWAKEALINLHVNPFYTNYIYLPFTVNLTLHTLTLFPSLIALVLQTFINNLVVVYNIIFVLTFIASGIGTYALIKYLTNNKWVSFICGFAFAFCPYIFSHAYAGHFNLMNTWSMPFYLCFLLQILDKRKIKYVFLAALIVILQIYTDLHYAFFLVLLSVIVIVYYFIIHREHIVTYLKHLSLLLVLCVVFSLPVLIPTYQFSKVYNAYQATRVNYEPAMDYTDLRHYFPGPNYLNTKLWGTDLKDSIEKNYKGGVRENNIFLGYTIMGLAMLGLGWTTIKNRSLYFIVAVLFFILSLGNYLYFGHALLLQEKLPYYYLAKTIFANTDIVFSRFSIMCELMLVILMGGFLAYLVEKTKFAKISYLIYVLVFLAIAAEFYCVPMTLTKMQYPEVLTRIAKEEGDFSVIILPSRLYYQTVISKPQLTGGLGRRAHDYYQELGPYTSIPGIHLLYNIPHGSIEPNADDLNKKLVHEQFAKYKIKYIMIDKVKTPEVEVTSYKQVLTNTLQLPIFYEDSDVVIYQTGL